MSKRSVFSIIGGSGFRAQAYLRTAAALPELFRVGGLLVRDEAKGQLMRQKWNVPVWQTLEELLKHERPDFIFLSVSKGTAFDYLCKLAELGIPVLMETPPASNHEELLKMYEQLMRKGARIQVAEQYPYMPMHQARLQLIHSGKLGQVTQAAVSVSHWYHGMALLRKFLGIGFEPAVIRGMRFEAPVIAGPDRNGPPAEEQRISSFRDLAWLDFGGKLGIYDFTHNQHRSWIRSNHVSIRGDRGELFDHRLNGLADFATPYHLDLKRINKGEEENLEGYFLQGIMAGEQWVYTNPFLPARLYDDELAIAACLKLMAAYAAGGPDFCSLADAAQDQYLGWMAEKAVLTGETVTTVKQPWA